MYKIRIHGRGGQGARMAAKILGTAGFIEGNDVQDFSLYGSERRGAPVYSFCRIGKEKIFERGYIDEPDFVIVLDDSLIKVVNVMKGLKENGVIVINSRKKEKELKLKTKAKIVLIDGREIALKELGKPIYNTVMLGAFIAATGILKPESLIKAVKIELGEHKKLAEGNIKAVKAAYKKVKEGMK